MCLLSKHYIKKSYLFHIKNIYDKVTWADLVGEVEARIRPFPKYGHVAYQIKGKRRIQQNGGK